VKGQNLISFAVKEDFPICRKEKVLKKVMKQTNNQPLTHTHTYTWDDDDDDDDNVE
jgi:phosphosulfolactate phosphohydrolase-like enzyme